MVVLEGGVNVGEGRVDIRKGGVTIWETCVNYSAPTLLRQFLKQEVLYVLFASRYGESDFKDLNNFDDEAQMLLY